MVNPSLNVDIKLQICKLYDGFFDIYLRDKDSSKAVDYLEKSIDTCEELVKDHKCDKRILKTYCHALNKLA